MHKAGVEAGLELLRSLRLEGLVPQPSERDRWLIAAKHRARNRGEISQRIRGTRLLAGDTEGAPQSQFVEPAEVAYAAPVLQSHPRHRDLGVPGRSVLLPECTVLVVAQRAGHIEALIQAELLFDILAERVGLDRPLTGRLDRAGVDARDARREDVRGVERSIEAVN